MARFARRIAPYVQAELEQAETAKLAGNSLQEFKHLEAAHVLGQASTYWHTRVHWLMLLWGIRQHSGKEISGQLIRIVGALTKTAFGWIPQGNTGGTNVRPFQVMPLAPKQAEILKRVNNQL